MSCHPVRPSSSPGFNSGWVIVGARKGLVSSSLQIFLVLQKAKFYRSMSSHRMKELIIIRSIIISSSSSYSYSESMFSLRSR